MTKKEYEQGFFVLSRRQVKRMYDRMGKLENKRFCLWVMSLDKYKYSPSMRKCYVANRMSNFLEYAKKESEARFYGHIANFNRNENNDPFIVKGE